MMAKSVALMSELQTSSTSSREARAYAREARQIGSHASGDMATKVEALSRSLRAYAAWVDSSVGKFRGEDFAVAGLELGNTCGLALPEGQNSLGDPQDGASPTLTGSSESNGIRHLTSFDVTLNAHTYGEGFIAANVTVCYVRPHPGANPDGSTRVSTDPWSLMIERRDGSIAEVPVSELARSSAPGPRYTEALVDVGECQTGWISVTPPGDGTFAGMKYAPKDFPQDTATWQW